MRLQRVGHDWACRHARKHRFANRVERNHSHLLSYHGRPVGETPGHTFLHTCWWGWCFLQQTSPCTWGRPLLWHPCPFPAPREGEAEGAGLLRNQRSLCSAPPALLGRFVHPQAQCQKSPCRQEKPSHRTQALPAMKMVYLAPIHFIHILVQNFCRRKSTYWASFSLKKCVIPSL